MNVFVNLLLMDGSAYTFLKLVTFYPGMKMVAKIDKHKPLNN